MNSIEIFKKALKQYLDGRAQSDALFAQAYAKEGKTLDDCANFVIGEIKKRAQNGSYAATDEEVYGLAVHYYDEDNVKVESVGGVQIVSNYQLTDQDKAELEAEAKEKAKESYLREAEEKAKKALEKKQEKERKKAAEQPAQPSLFGDLFNQ
jgi:hypothetical protein